MLKLNVLAVLIMDYVPLCRFFIIFKIGFGEFRSTSQWCLKRELVSLDPSGIQMSFLKDFFLFRVHFLLALFQTKAVL